MLNLLKSTGRVARVLFSKNEQLAKATAINLFSTEEKEEVAEGGEAEGEVQSGEGVVEEAVDTPIPETEEEALPQEFVRRRRTVISREIDPSVLLSSKRPALIAEDLKKYERSDSLFDEFKIFTSGATTGESAVDTQADIAMVNFFFD